MSLDDHLHYIEMMIDKVKMLMEKKKVCHWMIIYIEFYFRVTSLKRMLYLRGARSLLVVLVSV